MGCGEALLRGPRTEENLTFCQSVDEAELRGFAFPSRAWERGAQETTRPVCTGADGPLLSGEVVYFTT